MRRLLAAWLLCGAASAADFRDAVAALQRGDVAAAERILRAEIAANPNDAPALSTLGVVLDQQGKFAEAAPLHRRAVAAAPRTADVFSNYGNHLAASGDRRGAEAQYQKAVGLEPGHVNANLQLARLAPEKPEAIEHLKHVPAAQVEALVRNDPQFGFAVALGYAKAAQFERAEALFGELVAKGPPDFGVLFNLGSVAAQAGHAERARQVLEGALRMQPQNVDALVRLATVEQYLGQTEPAVRRLAQAAKIAPDRAEVQRLLAGAAASLGALDDAIAAWDRYRKLAPEDDTARRERGYLAVELGRIEEGAADLEWFLARHKDDPVALYYLGAARGDTALLGKAIEAKPDFVAARSARGNLFYQQANFEAALADLEPAAKVRPDDAVILDRLGQTYLSLDRAADAVRVLRRATEISPKDSKMWFHLGRALAEAGEAAESKQAMERFRELGPGAKGGVPAGLVEYLSMTPEQQRADYRARIEKVLREHPDDASAKLEFFKVSVEDGSLPEGSMAEAAALFAASKRADLYWHLVSLLAREGRAAEAWAAPVPEGDAGAGLIHVLLAEFTGHTDEATKGLADFERRRPEWFAVWVARAAVEAGHRRNAEARAALAKAKSLGARTESVASGVAGLIARRPVDW